MHTPNQPFRYRKRHGFYKVGDRNAVAPSPVIIHRWEYREQLGPGTATVEGARSRSDGGPARFEADGGPTVLR
jgi:hypothetical protein